MTTGLHALGELESEATQALLDATVAIGFSREVARAGLAAELDSWRDEAAMTELVARAEQLHRHGHAPSEVIILATRTLPASTLRHTMLSRLVGARVVLKPAAGQMDIARAIAAVDSEVSVLDPATRHTTRMANRLASAECVIALGSDETLREVASNVGPQTNFVGYGHRVSALWLESLDDEIARGVAHDLCAWDQAGCLSPQVLWTTLDVERTAKTIAHAVAEVESTMPMTLPHHAAVSRGEMKALGEMMGRVHETSSALIVALEDERFRPTPGYRALWVLPATRDALRAVEPQLSTLGLWGDSPVSSVGNIRICAPGMMQRPSLLWAQDGYAAVTSLGRPITA